jgi:putative PIN family toxin of toxin-antitoxin system
MDKKSLRVVVDTNVILSKYISKNGTAGRAFDHAISECRLLICDITLAEFAAKISTEKFSAYGSSEERSEFISLVEELAEFATVRSAAQASPDPDDNIFLALALDGRADYIVTGDKKHLLPLGSYKGIPILSPSEFLARTVSQK